MKKLTTSANMFFGSLMVMKTAKNMMRTLKGNLDKSRVRGSSDNFIEGSETRKSEFPSKDVLQEVIMEIADNPDEELSPKEKITSDKIIISDIPDSNDGNHRVEFLQLQLKLYPVRRKESLDYSREKLKTTF